jgi:hypothetical protein
MKNHKKHAEKYPVAVLPWRVKLFHKWLRKNFPEFCEYEKHYNIAYREYIKNTKT